MMVILEMLSRAYSNEHEVGGERRELQINQKAVFDMAVATYEQGLGLSRLSGIQDVVVCRTDEIPTGERKIIEVNGLSIGVFHHNGQWYALRNSCLHRGGPVCTGTLENNILICPWHGFQYDVTNGRLIEDPSAKLATYPVEVRDGEVHLQIPVT
jgi:nitrite reductase/ring-hydroxylating ferredoxin subunit